MDLKKANTVSYLGVEGSYSFEAARALFPRAQLKNFASFFDVLEAARTGGCDVAVVPIENSIAGRVADVHSLTLSLDLQIANEYLLKIEHCLIAKQGTESARGLVGLGRIRRVFSHPQALSQCKGYLAHELPQAEVISSSDTASAAKFVIESGLEGDAAIASAVAAKCYGGVVLASNIAETANNTTRFLSFTQDDNLIDTGENNMTTLIFQVEHRPGALVAALSIFEDFKINLTKLETYMVSEETTYPTFYVDVGSGFDENFRQAFSKLREKCIYIKLMGSYKASLARSARLGYLPVSGRG